MFGIQTFAQSARRSASFRRTLAGAGVVFALAAIAITAWTSHAARSARAPDVLLLYVGAEDCAPCRAWRNGEGAAFFASADFGRIAYREVKSPHLRDVLKDENWPDEIRSYRDRLRPSDGLPLWLVVSSHEIVEQRFGTAAWGASVLPTIKSLLR